MTLRELIDAHKMTVKVCVFPYHEGLGHRSYAYLRGWNGAALMFTDPITRIIAPIDGTGEWTESSLREMCLKIRGARVDLPAMDGYAATTISIPINFELGDVGDIFDLQSRILEVKRTELDPGPEPKHPGGAEVPKVEVPPGGMPKFLNYTGREVGIRPSKSGRPLILLAPLGNARLIIDGDENEDDKVLFRSPGVKDRYLSVVAPVGRVVGLPAPIPGTFVIVKPQILLPPWKPDRDDLVWLMGDECVRSYVNHDGTVRYGAVARAA